MYDNCIPKKALQLKPEDRRKPEMPKIIWHDGITLVLTALDIKRLEWRHCINMDSPEILDKPRLNENGPEVNNNNDYES